MKTLESYLMESLIMNNAYLFTPADLDELAKDKECNLKTIEKMIGGKPVYLAIRNKEVYLGFEDGARLWFTTQYPASRFQKGSTPYNGIDISFIKYWGGGEAMTDVPKDGSEEEKNIIYLAFKGLVWALERGTNSNPPVKK